MLAASYREDLYPSDLFLLPWGQSLFLSNLKGLSQLNSERHLISKQHLSLFISKYRRKNPQNTRNSCWQPLASTPSVPTRSVWHRHSQHFDQLCFNEHFLFTSEFCTSSRARAVSRTPLSISFVFWFCTNTASKHFKIIPCELQGSSRALGVLAPKSCCSRDLPGLGEEWILMLQCRN